MRLFALEIKRVLKTRLTWVLVTAALLLSVVCAWLPVTFVEVLTENEAGVETRLTGLDAIHYYQQYNEILYGEVTPEMVRNAVEIRQNLYRAYDSEYGENIPEQVYFKELWPYIRLSTGALEVMADPNNGIVPELLAIDASKLDNYYGLMEGRLSSVLRMENPDNPAAEISALKKFSAVQRPYTYYFGVGRNNMDYETLLMFAVCVICVVIGSTVFSTDSQTGADDIQRCSKHGGLCLALTKICSAMLICLTLLFLCGVIWIGLTSLFFGSAGNLSSVQILYSITSLVPWTMGQMQWGILWYTLLILCCTVAFTLFLSATCKNNVSSVAASLTAVILPMIVYVAVPEKIEKWLQCFLPSGGIGLANSVLYMLTDYDYLHLSSVSFWNADVLLAVTAAEIPLFLLLVMIRYQRKKCK